MHDDFDGISGGYPTPVMSALNPTPARLLVDEKGRPYFLWDVDMTLAEFQRRLQAHGLRWRPSRLVGRTLPRRR